MPDESWRQEGRGVKRVSTAKLSCWGIFPDDLRREAYNLSGPEVLNKLHEYHEAGATKVGYLHMPKLKRTKWGKVDYRE